MQMCENLGPNSIPTADLAKILCILLRIDTFCMSVFTPSPSSTTNVVKRYFLSAHFKPVFVVLNKFQVVSYGSEEVAEKAIMILKDVFTNLGPRLLANQARL